ncbi:MAG: acyl-CoA thioesterase [Granulosicoccus sp.]
MANIATTRQSYSYFKPISTRWIDNDVYGHINNAVYYTYFDTVCNSFLIEHCGFNIQKSPIVGFVVATSCQYVSPMVFPDTVLAAMRVNRLGNSSVEYGVGLFRNDENSVSAHGTFTHVFVNRETSKPVTIPDGVRNQLSNILRA